MTLQAFFCQFSMLSDAPNGVAQIRELVLQLAVRGQLDTRNPNDHSASTLLEKIEHCRAQRIQKKQIRPTKQLPAIQSSEIPFSIPETWQWIRLGEIGDWGAGATPNRSDSRYYDGDIRWFKSGELNDGRIRESQETITQLALKECSLRLNQPGDVLIAMYGATIGKLAILETEATTNQAVCACTCFDGFDNQYLFLLLRSYKKHFTKRGAGGAQPNISREKIIHTVAPLPPLEEQKRIVKRVEELMALCDELMERQQAKRESRVRLNAAVLAPLNKAASIAPEEFAQATTRLAGNFDTLYDSIDPIAELRSAILKLAVQGRLVPQLISEEPASILFEEIENVKKSLLEAGQIQKDKKPWSFTKDQPPWNIPSNWLWVRIQDLFEISRGGSPRPSGDPLYFGGKIPWITVGEITKDSLKYLYSTTDTLTHEGKKRSRVIYPDDLLLTNSGATLGVPKISKIEGCINDGVALLRKFHAYTINDYAYLFLTSQTDAFRDVKQGMGQPNLNTSILSGWFFPLPPLDEQRRIVAKVNQLMSLCDELETKLRQAEADSEKLMNAAVKHVLDSVRDASETAEEVFA